MDKIDNLHVVFFIKMDEQNLTFLEAIEYIKSLDIYGSVLGLDNMKCLAKELDNPEDGLRFIHVTGTNGKGSVSAFLASILKASGYKVGSYNSPAVLSDIDQFRINMKIISEELYAEAVTIVKSACERVREGYNVQPTRFEVETMVAFVAFYIEKCDIVVLETGLGGRDDATNIVNNSLLHIFTSISMDHSAILGDTLLKIAGVKSGIIKTSAPVLMYDRSLSAKDDEELKGIYEVNEFLKNKCENIGAGLYSIDDNSVSNISVDSDCIHFDIDEYNLKNLVVSMVGAYQPINAALSVKAAKILSDIGYNISDETIRKGLKKAKIPFRFEKKHVNDMVDIILDGAHNPDGARQLINSLDLVYPDREFIFITGIFKDKDYESIALITAKRASKILVIQNSNSERSLDKETLASVLRRYNDNVKIADEISSALDEAIDDATNTICANAKHSVIVCFGSLSWLNEAKQYIKNRNASNNLCKPSDNNLLGTEDILISADEENKKEKIETVNKADIIEIVNDIVKTGENKLDLEKIKQGVELILQGVGEDPNREGLKDTPARVARMYEEIFAGLGKTAQAELEKTFASDAKEIVIEKDIEFFSTCEHHLLPFFGKAHIAYIPDGKVVGLSKLARCVEIYSKKPQIQEQLTEEIADAIMTYLKPKGVLVMLEAEHMCMTMRGVKKPGTKTVTISTKGKMKRRENQDLFFQMIK